MKRDGAYFFDFLPLPFHSLILFQKYTIITSTSTEVEVDILLLKNLQFKKRLRDLLHPPPHPLSPLLKLGG